MVHFPFNSRCTWEPCLTTSHWKTRRHLAKRQDFPSNEETSYKSWPKTTPRGGRRSVWETATCGPDSSPPNCSRRGERRSISSLELHNLPDCTVKPLTADIYFAQPFVIWPIHIHVFHCEGSTMNRASIEAERGSGIETVLNRSMLMLLVS